MNVTLLANNFIGGEISPAFAGRIETAPYQYGAKRLENFIVMDSGGICKRPGTWFDGYTMNRGKARLIDFPLTDGHTVICEFGDMAVRFWLDDYTVLKNGEGEDHVLDTVYTADMLSDIKYAVSKDVLYLVHPQAVPHKIIWNYDNTGLPVIDTLSLTGPAITNPSAVAFNSGRLFLASTADHPNGIWASRAPDSAAGTDRYEDFTMTTGGVPLASDGIYLEENDMTGSRIKWLTNNRRLVALTGRTSWEDSGEMVTPATFDMRIVEYSGASGVQGLGNKDAIIYIDSSEKTLRALVFNAESQNAGFADTPLGPWANHILLAKVREFAVVNYPFPMAWLILQDGSLVSCTLDIRGGVAAFCRHPMNGFVESIQSGRDGGEDMLWLVVNHNGDRAIEHLIVREAAGQKFDESHYVDSGKRFMFTNATAHIEGLMHLAGREVSLFADGAPLPGKTVSNEGTLDLEYPVLKLHAGLPVRSLFEANTLETPANGTSLGNKRRVQSARLLLFESSGGAGGADEQHLEPLEYTRYGAYKAGSAPEPFTGTQELTVSGNIDSTGAFVLVHGEPVPFTLLALVERVAVIEV